uniref:Glycosyltransferase family 32 protein n=1 Tax=Macrostomum lignano TaxID=282301 RepID=A0A1I8FN04_9PLAT
MKRSNSPLLQHPQALPPQLSKLKFFRSSAPQHHRLLTCRCRCRAAQLHMSFLHHFLPSYRQLVYIVAVALLCYISYQQRWVYVTWDDPDSGQQRQQQQPGGTPPAAGGPTHSRVEELIRQIAASGQSDSVRMNRSDDPKKCRDVCLRCSTRSTPQKHKAYRGHLLSCLRLNYPDFAYVLWTDDDAAAFLADKFPVHSAMFSGYAKALQRSDALRYFILSYFGGIYADMDVQCLRPFNRLAAAESCFLDQERWEQSQILHGSPSSPL